MSTKQGLPPVREDEVVEPVLDAFARMFVAATIYLDRHPRVVALAETCRTALQSAAAGTPFVLGLREQKFFVGERPVRNISGPLERVRANLDSLAIATIRFAPGIAAVDLARFAGALQSAVQQSVRGSFEFDVWIQELPAGVTVERDQVGVPSFDAETRPRRKVDRSFRKTLVERALSPLSHHAVSPAVVSALRRFADSFFDATTQLFEEDGNHSTVPLDDLLAISGQALERTIGQHIDSGEEQLDLDSLFSELSGFLELSLGKSDVREVLGPLRTVTDDLLNDHFAFDKPLITPLGRKRRHTEGTAVHVPAVDDLEQWLFAHPLQPMTFAPRPDETFAIAMFGARESQTLIENPRFLQRIGTLWTANIESPQPEFIQALDLMGRHDRDRAMIVWTLGAGACAAKRLDHFPKLVKSFQGTLGEQERWALLALASLLADQPPAKTDSLWAPLLELAGDDAVGLLEQSVQLLTSRGVKWWQIVSQASTWAVLEAVMRARGLRPWWDQVMRAVQESPPHTPAGSAVEMFQLQEAQAPQFFRRLLTHAVSRRRDTDLDQQAAERMIRFLRRGDPRARNEAHACALIRTLAFLETPSVERFLEEVENRKNGLLRRYYPTAWRKEAREALSQRVRQAARRAPSKQPEDR